MSVNRQEVELMKVHVRCRSGVQRMDRRHIFVVEGQECGPDLSQRWEREEL